MTHTPGVKALKLDLDRQRTLVLDLDAFCAYQAITGKNPFAHPPESPVEIRAVLFAGLAHEDPELTLEQVGKLVHMGNMAELLSQINAAFNAAGPQPGDVPLEAAAVAPAS